VQEVPGRADHREDKTAELDVQYGPAHDVRVSEGGVLSKLLSEKSFRVNSLHSQGIDRLAEPLFAEAAAPDGQIEAVSMPSARGFLLGVQWHPEWKWSTNPVSRVLFGAFGTAIRENRRV
jgi:putative glutamine amidotransferase